MIALASLSESARKIALDRFRLLQPHLEAKRLLKAVARDAGIGYRTAQRWMMHRKHGLAGLARNDRVDRGQRRAITPELKEILEALALQKPPLPIAALHRQLHRIAIERGQPVPNYKAVYRVVRHLPADLVMLAHEGSKAYGETFELIYRREADRPNAIWQADHTLLDIMLVRDGAKLAKPSGASRCRFENAARIFDTRSTQRTWPD
jgi:putative transposase